MNNKLDINIIEKYVNGILSDEFHRYRSWDYCFTAFSEKKDSENYALQLAFYLASWGMYRGSSGLLQKNHLVHHKVIEIIFDEKYKKLRYTPSNEINKNSISIIMQLKNELVKHYERISFSKAGEKKFISPTDTLISKIMLGTLACVPAYDRYFIEGLRIENAETLKFDEMSLREIFDFIENNKREISEFQKFVKQKTNTYYPVMKIIDMYFWQIGFDNK